MTDTPPPAPPSWQPSAAAAPRRQWPMFVFFTVALLVTLGVAIVGWFRPLPPKAPVYTSQQVAEAKAKVCTAFEQARAAVRTTSSGDRGPDYVTQLATAVNARQGLVAAGQYLFTILNDQTATPADIAHEMHVLASAYQLEALEYMAGKSDADVSDVVRSADGAASDLEKLCK